MTVIFELDEQEFMALNGGPIFSFTPAISFIVNCDTQEEIDYFWEKLSADGQKIECGWLTDKYGISWQIVPTILKTITQSKDSEKIEKVMSALLKMKKLDIATLEKAFKS